MTEVASLEKDTYSTGKKDFQLRSLKNFKQSLGKLLGRRSVNITEYDPVYKVVYLGNVLTGWAKGDACTEKPLNTLWKNYVSNSKSDVQMKLTITQSGLKAVTKDHGLTEYWSHRITYCCAPRDFPRIFCWVYRHEGRKLKQELRCHAVLCSKQCRARLIATQLQARLTQALIEFKRDKINRQNARLSLANSVYDNPSMPRRKILLSTGSQNYRPPLERSKSAPKLMSIEECLEEEEEENECRYFAGSGSVGAKPKMLCRVDRKSGPRFNCRNLNYSSRGGKFGGLHGQLLSVTAANDENIHSDDAINDAISGNDEPTSSQRCPMVIAACAEIVEENPFGPASVSSECDLLESINSALELRGLSKVLPNNNDTATQFNGHTTGKPAAVGDLPTSAVGGHWKFKHRNSWTAGDKLSSSNSNNFVSSSSSYCDDVFREIDEERENEDEEDLTNLPDSRDQVFLLDERQQQRLVEKTSSPPSGDDKCILDIRSNESDEDTNGILMRKDDCDSDVISSMDEESTASLQSVSSGSSDIYCPKDGSANKMSSYMKNYDLDSLWEESSDESGYADSCQEVSTDDKIRDIPHHQLMRNCILTPKSQCLEV